MNLFKAISSIVAVTQTILTNDNYAPIVNLLNFTSIVVPVTFTFTFTYSDDRDVEYAPLNKLAAIVQVEFHVNILRGPGSCPSNEGRIQLGEDTSDCGEGEKISEKCGDVLNNSAYSLSALTQ